MVYVCFKLTKEKLKKFNLIELVKKVPDKKIHIFPEDDFQKYWGGRLNGKA